MFSLLIFLLWSFGSHAQGAGVTKTSFQFSRRVQTCDVMDRDIEEATTKLLWAYGTEDPQSPAQIQYHGRNRGITSVRFFNDEPPKPLPPDTQYFDLTLNNDEINFATGILRDDTNYFCKAHKIYLSEKRHIIKSEPIIQPGNERYVHHFIVSICTSAIPAEDLAHTGPCYDKANMPSSLYNCNSGFGDMLPAWAVGGGEYNLPDNVGFPVGPGDVFIVVETHFDNPEMHTIWDSSGMRYYHTGNLRPLEGGSMFVGLTVDNLFQIPPRQQAFQADAWCTADCTNQLPQDGLHLFGATLHTHVAGRSVKLRLIDSEGQEQKPILYEPFYDFNYQDNTVIDRMLHRGDVLKLECVYNTMDRSEPTLGGQSTAEEMCLAYLFYWPKIDWGGCLSMDYTKTVSSQRGKVQYCGRSEFTYAELTNYTEYTAPPCNRVAPDANALVPLLAQGPLDFSSYPSGRYLDKEQKFKMYWRINRNTLSIDIGLEVETAGWVSLGISPMGMINADMVVAWVRDGVAYFDDRLATAQAMPRTDLELGGTEDIYRITGSEYTVLPPAKSNKLSQENKIVLGSGVAILVGFLFFFFWLRWRAKRLRSIETNPLIGSPNKGKAGVGVSDDALEIM